MIFARHTADCLRSAHAFTACPLVERELVERVRTRRRTVQHGGVGGWGVCPVVACPFVVRELRDGRVEGVVVWTDHRACPYVVL